MIARCSCVAALIAISPAITFAQRCLGTAPFEAGVFQAAFIVHDAGHDVDARTIQLGFGAERGIFGAVRVNQLKSDSTGTETSSRGYGITGGYAFNLTKMPRIQTCPLFVIDYKRKHLDFDGPEANSDEINTFILRGGFSVGAVLSSSGRFTTVGSTALMLVDRRVRFGPDYAEPNFIGPGTVSKRYGTIDIGLGLVFFRKLTLRPAVSVPIGLPGGKPRFGAGVAFSFGEA
jgi:hypothetical protein